MRTGQAREQGQVSEDERLCQEPVEVAQPEHLAVVLVRDVGDVLVVFADEVMLPSDALAGSEGEIDDEGDGGGDGDQAVEDAFGLGMSEGFGLGPGWEFVRTSGARAARM